MGLEFLHDNGGRRIRNYDEQPFLLSDGLVQKEAEQEGIDRGYEVPPEEWAARDAGAAGGYSSWPLRPTRFVDGKDVGRTVAWLQTREGYPVPVRLSEIGAAVLCDMNGELRREFSRVERVVSLMVDPFPWDEVEAFAISLRREGFRLLACDQPEGGWSYDFERMRKTTQNRSNDEMTRLERLALAQDSATPTIVDGRLEPRARAFDPDSDPVVGLIKTHAEDYLHPQGWRVFYDLRPGQRTPAFHLKEKNLSVVSWYVRLDGDRGELPNWGIVRLEVPQPYFEIRLNKDWTYLDRLTELVCAYRSRDEGYGRSAVSIHPIQRAEESLGSLFTSSDTLISHFYRLTSL